MYTLQPLQAYTYYNWSKAAVIMIILLIYLLLLVRTGTCRKNGCVHLFWYS